MNQSSHFINLPSGIITDIFARLSILDIARLKCVCKAWLESLTSPEFSKLHLSKSPAGLLIFQQLRVSRVLKIFGFESELEVHDLNYIPVTEFDITGIKGDVLAGSVDGFLCLLGPGHIDDLFVCNPITHEYISLPTLESFVRYPGIVTYGFGVSTIGCQYKVVRIFHDSELDVCVRTPRSDCHVYTLGTTGTWRSIALEPSPPLRYSCYSIGAFLNGNLHWLVGDLKDSYLISCLDLDKEMFRTFSAPPLLGRCLGSLVVFGDCLSVCDNSSENDIVIWMMRDYGVGTSWAKEFVISKIPDLAGEGCELVFPIKVFRNGDILMIWRDCYLFYYSNKTKTTSKIDIVEMADCGSIEAMLHVPALVSLTCFGRENVESF